ncbi:MULTISPECIES: hypothetical protein [Carnobacterium]|uniref:DNA-directed RNA polymerase beta subunit n=1 Tax=Carnobacterium antarcticum TaxID=2126436 RepID=A0ABW4NP72_9LACT|nr:MULTISPECIES: hypothetical protein [unclassified Carnobacterium]ALV20817.1 DNA-directed RNA polymerase beta subunit [Carnobacterium sp. CP1]QQP70977.1 hypothetical protein JHE06_04150 [Carnobacterium sp. CS13]
MSFLNEEYRDRGIKKWAGFYLSEHTAVQEKLSSERTKVNQQKRQMNQGEIEIVINESIVKNKSVAIQLENVDQNGFYYDDVVGHIVGGDELGIFINNTKVDFDEIRNIQFVVLKKWNNTDDDV